MTLHFVKFAVYVAMVRFSNPDMKICNTFGVLKSTVYRAVPGLFTRLFITSNLRLYAVLRGIPGFDPGNPV